MHSDDGSGSRRKSERELKSIDKLNDGGVGGSHLPRRLRQAAMSATWVESARGKSALWAKKIIVTVLLPSLVISHPAAGGAQAFNLADATIADIQAAFDAGALTSERLVQLYLDRIEAYDKAGPRINAVIRLNPKALEEARALDIERSSHGPRSPLHGIAVVLKDLFDTYDMPTTGGFLPLANSQPYRDAFVVKKLRDAGAIILAKVNLTDWYGVPAPGDHSTLGGRTQNPYNLERTPGSSSGGTGAAIAAYFATVGLGTETGRSIRNPLSNNNLVGMAPTQGLISRTGVMMTSFTQERVGPFARSVYDMAALLSIMVGFDADDLVTAQSLGQLPEEPYTRFISEDGLRGARIGVLRDLFRSGPVHEEALQLVEQAIADMKGQGAVVLDPVTTGLDLFEVLATARTNSDEARFAYDHYFGRLGRDAPVRNTEELIQKGGDLLKPGIARSAKIESLDRYPQYLARLKTREALRQVAIEMMDRHQLDILVYPHKTQPAQPHGQPRLEIDNAFSSITGLPALLVPAGFVSDRWGDNLPIAVEFLGRPFSEPTLIRIASGYEAATRHRKTPESTPPLPGETFTYDLRSLPTGP